MVIRRVGEGTPTKPLDIDDVIERERPDAGVVVAEARHIEPLFVNEQRVGVEERILLPSLDPRVAQAQLLLADERRHDLVHRFGRARVDVRRVVDDEELPAEVIATAA